jgi:hypothetical protein
MGLSNLKLGRPLWHAAWPSMCCSRRVLSCMWFSTALLYRVVPVPLCTWGHPSDRGHGAEHSALVQLSCWYVAVCGLVQYVLLPTVVHGLLLWPPHEPHDAAWRSVCCCLGCSPFMLLGTLGDVVHSPFELGAVPCRLRTPCCGSSCRV